MLTCHTRGAWWQQLHIEAARFGIVVPEYELQLRPVHGDATSKQENQIL